MLKSSGTVYEILNTENGFRYIGCTMNYEQRKHEHLILLRKGSHPNKNLQQDFNKYGEASFDFNIISTHRRYETAVHRERVIILSTDLLYNIMQYKFLRKYPRYSKLIPINADWQLKYHQDRIKYHQKMIEKLASDKKLIA